MPPTSPSSRTMAPVRLSLPAAAEVDALLGALAADHTVARTPAVTVRRVVLDTFDWRLHGAGLVLERERVGRRAELVLRSLDGDEVVRVPSAALPTFVDDLPDGPLRAHLGPVVEMRAMAPVAELVTERVTARVEDDEGKTRVRVVVERNRLAARRGGGADLGAVLTVVPLRGYEPDARRVADLFAVGADASPAGTDPAPAGTDPVLAAFDALGLEPGWYSSKLRVPLDPSMAAADAVRRVLVALRQTMRDNEAGMLADVDSEFLHDYRVAVRRTRSVLGQAKGVLPPALLAWAGPEWKWLGTITSPTRDLDVWLLTLPELEVSVPPLLEGGLARLHEHIGALQREAHATLVAELDSPRAHELFARWDAWLGDADALLPEGPAEGDAVAAAQAEAPVVDVARQRIWKAYRRVRDDGRAIGPDTPGPVLHELRKDAKKLRYLLECYASLFPPEEMKSTVRELKLVQDVLGTFQDCEVQVATLTGFGEGVLRSAGRTDRAATARTLMAMGSLVELIDERRLAARAAFAERFERFDDEANRRRYRQLFREGS